MSEIEKSILNRLWVYSASLELLIFLNLYHKYSKQVDITIENMYITSQMLLMEARREYDEVKCQ